MSLDKSDLYQFVKYTLNGEMVRALLVLEGLIRGISMDGKINTIEIAELKNWYQLHEEML